MHYIWSNQINPIFRSLEEPQEVKKLKNIYIETIYIVTLKKNND